MRLAWTPPLNFAIRQASALDAEAIGTLVTGLVHDFIADPTLPDVQPFLDSLTPDATAARIVAPEFDYCVAEALRPLGSQESIGGNPSLR